MGATMTLNDLFRLDDGGRSASRRPKQRNDCTVRAVAIAEGLEYDLAYDELKDAGRQCARTFRFTEWANKQPERFEKISFPAVKGQPRMNVERFCRQFTEGHYILNTAKHVMAVKDGVVHDADPPGMERCVYTAYRVQR
jgi:hypothetical protein